MTAAIQGLIDEHLRALADLYRIVDGRRKSGKPLSEQELLTCTLAASGLSNKEIAARLWLAEDTIKMHLRRSFFKLGLRRRSQLAQVLSGRGDAA